MPADPFEQQLVERIRRGEAEAWQGCIDRYEGRLLAFARSRVRQLAAAEDIVQETFLGFLTSLPNYDTRTPLESFLFAIAAHKITDHLRREGRRPTFSLLPDDSHAESDRPGDARVASSMARSHERRTVEAGVLGEALSELITRWKRDGEWERLMCAELLIVCGWPNKQVASRLGISEQAVANHKHFIVNKLREAGLRARLSAFELDSLGLSN
ncbi:MAG: sigma-70 family RNA polymerase sigma factor [Planctomycetaceae bacterium]